MQLWRRPRAALSPLARPVLRSPSRPVRCFRPPARHDNWRRLRELQEELDEAESWSDPERADRAREQMEYLARELARGVGLGGRDRLVGSAAERARISVTRAIRLAMARITEHSPALGEHLQTTIHTGTYCAYRPDPRVPVRWET